MHTFIYLIIIPTIAFLVFFWKFGSKSAHANLIFQIVSPLKWLRHLLEPKEWHPCLQSTQREQLRCSFLNIQFRAPLHLWRGFAFSIYLLQQAECLPNEELYFPWGTHRQTIQVYFVPFKLLSASRATGEQQSLPWSPARAAWQGGQATLPELQTALWQGRPSLSSANSLLMLLLLRGLPLKIH